ncbi:MAG TPA: hypothetical protein VMV62_02375 [Candidatus Paceibacterota bacterium]|nr:hypothetical protein [Candidatus Paceibacterota bacterium]
MKDCRSQSHYESKQDDWLDKQVFLGLTWNDILLWGAIIVLVAICYEYLPSWDFIFGKR